MYSARQSGGVQGFGPGNENGNVVPPVEVFVSSVEDEEQTVAVICRPHTGLDIFINRADKPSLRMFPVRIVSVERNVAQRCIYPMIQVELLDLYARGAVHGAYYFERRLAIWFYRIDG